MIKIHWVLLVGYGLAVSLAGFVIERVLDYAMPGEEETYDGPMENIEKEISLTDECFIIRIESATEQEREDDENEALCKMSGGSVGLSFSDVEDVTLRDTRADLSTVEARFYNGTVTYQVHHSYTIYSVDMNMGSDRTLILFTTRDPGVDYEMPPVEGDPS